MTSATLPDEDDARLAGDLVQRAPALLAAFNAAGVLGPSDVHVAMTLGRLAGEDDDLVLLAAAFAARAPRRGDVCADLGDMPAAAVAGREDPEVVGALAWPQAGAWLAAVAASPLVGVGDAGDAVRALHLHGTLLYLDRYWRYERLAARILDERAAAGAADPTDGPLLARGLDRLLPAAGDDRDLQRAAAEVAVRRRLAVIAGGPGTGKTRTAGAVLALLDEQAAGAGRRPPRVALAAPTGKAAARLTEAIRDAAAELDLADEQRARLRSHEASTLHRLLGSRSALRTRFRHHAGNPLPHDVVVVDETSMVPLSLMAKLLDALRPDARLVLIGDPEQLEAVEAGSVLGDIVGPMREAVAPVGGIAARSSGLADGIVVLRRVHRFDPDSGIAAVAGAVQRGDADGVLAVLGETRPDLRWIDAVPDAGGWDAAALAPVRAAAAEAAAHVLGAARSGMAEEALAGLGAFRILCTHRRGPFGVGGWVPMVERWLADDVDGYATAATWYIGRPVIVTRNDYALGVFNGDTGLVVAGDDGRPAVAFPAGDGHRMVSPSRLDDVETVHAMTVHKSQGSQFGHVVVVLAEPQSPILTRELLYTAATRAEHRLTIVGSAGAVRAGVQRRAHRTSGLRTALWGA